MVTVADLGFGGMRATMVFRSRASRARATAGVPPFRALTTVVSLMQNASACRSVKAFIYGGELAKR
jgi:hypothetical protein